MSETYRSPHSTGHRPTSWQSSASRTRSRGDGGFPLDRLRKGPSEFDGVGVVALDAEKLGAAGKHPVQFVGEQSDRLVAFLGFDASVHGRSVDRDVPLCLEARVDILFRVVFQLDANAQYSLLVPEQPLGFLLDKGFE